jgi:hypothetical protein
MTSLPKKFSSLLSCANGIIRKFYYHLESVSIFFL